jgi:hypothetical protein
MKEVVMIRVSMSVAALFASAICVTACGGESKQAPPPATSAQLQSAQLQASGPRPGDVGAPAACTSADLERVTKERDSAKQWAAEEQRRQETEMRMRRQRADLEEASWKQLDAIDSDIRELRDRLDRWIVHDRKATYAMLQDIEAKRGVAAEEVRRIGYEPEHSFSKLKVDVQVDLDELQELVKQALSQR